MGLTIGSNQEYRIELSEPSTTGCPGGDYVKREYLGDYVLSGTTDVVLKSLDGSRCSDFPTTMCWFMADYIDFEAKPVDTCGNGVCEPYESTESCPADCARQAVIDKLDFLEREVKKMPVSYFDKPSAVNKGRFLVALQMVEALFKIKKYQPALNIMECYIKNRSDTCTMAGDWFSPAGCGAQTNILQEIFDTISLMKQACPNCAEPDCFHFRFN